MTDLSIIIPVFNSASCLKDTVQTVITSIEKTNKTYEIILIDDGSSDFSWPAIKDIKALNANVVGVRLNKNYGQHNALLCGLNICSGNYIVTLDDDLEQNPADIEKLQADLQAQDLDMVYGIPAKSNKSILRVLFRYFYIYTSRKENKNAGEGSSFRIFTKKLKDSLITHSGSLFFLDEITLWYTDKIGYVKVDFQKSKKSNSGYDYGSLVSLWLRVLSLSSTMPLRIVRVVGFYIFLFSGFLAMIFIVRKFMFHVPMGYTSIIVAILFSTGIITASLGVIGEYLGNLIALSNNKPSYSIKEKI